MIQKPSFYCNNRILQNKTLKMHLLKQNNARTLSNIFAWVRPEFEYGIKFEFAYMLIHYNYDSKQKM